MKKILFIIGTRPEAIKSIPVLKALKALPHFEVKLCITAQHRGMLDQILAFFDIQPDFDLDLMKSDQTLFDVHTVGLQKIEPVLDEFKPDLIFVQGDTNTAYLGAQAGFYKKIKVAHIEAGLRSHHKYSPFPEEMNRRLISQLTDIHFTPTLKATRNLKNEGFTDSIFQVGNTVIDALLSSLELIKNQDPMIYSTYFASLGVQTTQKFILVTGHRRESFGEPLEKICKALIDVAKRLQIPIVYSVHLNPNIQKPVQKLLGHSSGICIIPPLDYPRFVWLMKQCYLIVTDSGGIQEEAPTLNKPVLVTRTITERMEGIESGTAKLVGHDPLIIFDEIEKLIIDPVYYEKMSQSPNPYGDGLATQRILEHINNLG